MGLKSELVWVVARSTFYIMEFASPVFDVPRSLGVLYHWREMFSSLFGLPCGNKQTSAARASLQMESFTKHL